MKLLVNRTSILRVPCCLVFALLGFAVSAQEICTNGLDDDGDGLIDLNDIEDCACSPSANEPLSSIIPNASFEEFQDCPFFPTQLHYAAPWYSPTNTTPEYLNTCGYTTLAAFTEGILPFPDGEGGVGLIASTIWKEYMASCLTEPMVTGQSYRLSFFIASTPVLASSVNFSSCNDAEIFYGDLEMTLYGSPSCGLDILPNENCLTDGGNDWTALGSVTYSPQKNWTSVDIIFSPTFLVQSIAIGSGCNLDPSFATIGDCYPYFYLDNLVLNEEALFLTPQLLIGREGDICSDAQFLEATILPSGFPESDYQWYKNGIALIGETDIILSLPAGIESIGAYQFRLQSPDDCFLSSPFEVNSALPMVEILSAPVCQGELASFTATGAEQYLWSNGATSESVEIEANDLETLSVVGFLAGCSDTAMVVVEVLPIPVLNVSGASFIPPGGQASLLASGTGTDYLWSPSQGLDCNDCTDPIASPAVTTEYCVTSQLDGCSATQCVVVNVGSFCESVFTYDTPTAFTPNGDGINDLFCIEGWENCLERFNISIFNEWGQIVFQTGDIAQCWDGTQGGRPLNPGVFVFFIEAIITDVGDISRTGKIALMK